MHFEILVEDRSGKELLDRLLSKLIGEEDTFSVHSYRGIGHIPANLQNTSDPRKRLLLAELPKLLRGYGVTFAGYPIGYKAALICVCDLDDRCLKEFRSELLALLATCMPKPEVRFCVAVEEIEAWLLGDTDALKVAFPNARQAVLNSYVQDAICGTWELLADVVYEGGASALKARGYPDVGIEKCSWARKIAGEIDAERNGSKLPVLEREDSGAQTSALTSYRNLYRVKMPWIRRRVAQVSRTFGPVPHLRHGLIVTKVGHCRASDNP